MKTNNKDVKSISKKAGLPPGVLMHLGKRRAEQVKVSVIDFNENDHSEITCSDVSQCFSFFDNDNISWINVDGLHEVDTIAAIGERYKLHPLLMEDVLNTGHRPKVEEYDNNLFFTLKMVGVSKDGKSILSEQVSFVLGKSFLISFQEREGDIFDGLRARLRKKAGRIHKMGPDYLLYRLIDTIVDNYFFVTDYFNVTTENLEERVLSDPDPQKLKEIQKLKKQLINFRKVVYPLREAVTVLQKDHSHFIKKSTLIYLRDVYEHVIHVNDSIDSQRDFINSIMDLYQSGVSNKMNQVMKVLTIIATIFIPLTFVAGIYGMNFDNMPELHWKYGYFGAWGLMLFIFMLMIIFFRRKKWL